jgi:predicted DCC family thiol-disulfide oxidoreductase YuxK
VGTLVYDGDCGFCTRSATWIAARGNVTIQPWQHRERLPEGLTEEDVHARAYWVEDDVPVAGGAEAIARAMQARGGLYGAYGRLLRTRLMAAVADRSYRKIAHHRHQLPGSSDACRVDGPPS